MQLYTRILYTRMKENSRAWYILRYIRKRRGARCFSRDLKIIRSIIRLLRRKGERECFDFRSLEKKNWRKDQRHQMQAERGSERVKYPSRSVGKDRSLTSGSRSGISKRETNAQKERININLPWLIQQFIQPRPFKRLRPTILSRVLTRARLIRPAN